MFIKIDKKTLQEEPISSEAMVLVLEVDMKQELIDEALTDMVCGRYEHSNAKARYKYRAE